MRLAGATVAAMSDYIAFGPAPEAGSGNCGDVAIVCGMVSSINVPDSGDDSMLKLPRTR